MSRAGFVLAGGKSTRMGSDKALLHFRGTVLVARVAAVVAQAAGSVTLIGDPHKYSHLGHSVLPDLREGMGPAAGIEAALTYTAADWNLILACDMPAVSPDFLRALLAHAEQAGADALLPAGPDGRLEPLAAVYHRRCLARFSAALDSGVRKITDVLAGLTVAVRSTPDAVCFENLNTPEEWAFYHDAH